MFELMLFLNRTYIEQVVSDQPAGGQLNRFFGSEPIIPYRTESCEPPSVIGRFHCPLIPRDRPLPADFVASARDVIEAAVTQAVGLRMMGAGGWGEVGPDRDMIGHRQPKAAAGRVLRLAHWWLEDETLDVGTRSAIEDAARQTTAYLNGA
jgi:hypothetical protein